jgi:phospholipid/cholesterol/gamma-HCH transport system substrate-binding protein
VARNVVETTMGAAVLIVAVGFTAYAFSQSGASRPSGYELTARFDRVDGVKRGTDVSLAGVKVGSVLASEVDLKTYTAVVRFAVDGAVKLPADTAAKIVSEGLLGGAVILLEPGSADAQLKPGEEIGKTQGARSIVELLITAAVGGSVNQPKN